MPAARTPAKAARGDRNVGEVERMLSSIAGGALLLSALRSPTPASAARLAGGAALLHRGVTGHCYLYSALGRSTADSSDERAAIRRTITIGKSPDELYRSFSDPKQLAAIMSAFVRVEDQSNGRLRWTVALPREHELSWTTLTTDQQPGELIAWRTESGAPFMHEGSVRFRKAPSNLGTEVTLSMSFGAEHGALRTLTSKWLRTIPRTLEESILRRWKSLCEAGEIPTLERNPAARAAAHAERAAKPNTSTKQSAARSLS
jgi:uncharacterized membrane protein